MRISDWSSDVCSSDRCWYLRCNVVDEPRLPEPHSGEEAQRPGQRLRDGERGGVDHLGVVELPEGLGVDDPGHDGAHRSRIALPRLDAGPAGLEGAVRSEEHTSELQSLMRISYAVFF